MFCMFYAENALENAQLQNRYALNGSEWKILPLENALEETVENYLKKKLILNELHICFY